MCKKYQDQTSIQRQKNFVITANRPDNSADGFYKNIAENQKSENVYMSSVTYGRRVIGVIETELDAKSIGGLVNASYSGFGVSANVGLDVLSKMDQSKTTVRLFYIGEKGNVITIPNPIEASILASINQWMTNNLSSGCSTNRIYL